MEELDFYDAPKEHAIATAREELRALGALDGDGRVEVIAGLREGVGDTLAGTFACMGALAALHHRERTGEGAHEQDRQPRPHHEHVEVLARFEAERQALAIMNHEAIAKVFGSPGPAVTSTKGMMRRLGKKWQKLHRLVYVIAIVAVWHFYWQVKLDTLDATLYAAALAFLLGYRAWGSLKRRRFSVSPSFRSAG